MSKNLSNCFYTMKDIETIWDKNGWNKRKWKDDTMTKKFREMLVELGLEEMVAWYRSKTNSGNDGKYIFSDPETPKKIKDLFDLYYGNKQYITLSDMNKAAGILKELLPYCRRVEDLQELMKSLSESDASPKGFVENEERKNQLLSEVHSSVQKKWEIEDTIRQHMAENLKPELYEARLFVEAGEKWISRETERKKIYEYQYRLIQNWHMKWKSIMDDAIAARRAELFEMEYGKYLEPKLPGDKEGGSGECGACEDENGSNPDECTAWIRPDEFGEALLDIYEEDADKHSEPPFHLEEILKDKEGQGEKAWRTRCRNLVGKVLSHPLKQTSEADFHYLILNAFQELEDIRDQVRRRRYEGYYCRTDDVEREDLEKLSRIRKKVESRPRNLLKLLY